MNNVEKQAKVLIAMNMCFIVAMSVLIYIQLAVPSMPAMQEDVLTEAPGGFDLGKITIGTILGIGWLAYLVVSTANKIARYRSFKARTTGAGRWTDDSNI